MRFGAVLVCLLSLMPTAPAAAAPPRLAASDIIAVVVGVLEWQDTSIRSFSTDGRQDRALHDALIDLGVEPANMILLLDGAATAAGIRRGIERACQRSTDRSTLVVYYAGHGARTPNGLVLLASDASSQAGTGGVNANDMARTIGSNFKGQRVLLFADCCFSGGLGAAADIVRQAGKRAAALTSAEAANFSTGNWTFTMALIDGLRGRAMVDADRDGTLTLGEIAAGVGSAMKHWEYQKNGFALAGVDPNLTLVPSITSPPPAACPEGFARGAFVRIDGRGQGHGRIVDCRGRQVTVEVQRYNHRERHQVPASAIARPVFAHHPVGSRVKVLWGRKLWDATILELKDDFHKITYPGWEAEWNEWVLSNRIRDGLDYPAGTPDAAALETAACNGRYSNLLKSIEVKDDYWTHGQHHEAGYWRVSTWKGHTNLPAGYWVYVYPKWYIWGSRR